MDSKEENRLIKKVQKHNDKNAANVLVAYYYREIYAFTYKQTVDIELSMDLTQDIFISALQSISGYDSKKSKFRTWLYRIASYKITDYYRSAVYKHCNNQLNIEETEIKADINIQELLETKEAVQTVISCISKMNFETQQILRLKLFSDYKFSEISEIISVSENTVKTGYYKALAVLRKELTNSGYYIPRKKEDR